MFSGSTEYRRLPKTNLSQIPKTIKTTENYSRLVPFDAGMHRKVPKYTDIDKIRRDMHSLIDWYTQIRMNILKKYNHIHNNVAISDEREEKDMMRV